MAIVEKLAFEDWLLTYYGMDQEEYSKVRKEERRAMRKEYDEYVLESNQC